MSNHIQSLPVELLEIVFEHVASTSCAPLPVKGSGIVTYQASFPFNVAATCRAWLSVLMHHWKYWDRIIIDIAEDPTPFLDVLEIHQQRMTKMTLQIIIFSGVGCASHGITSEESKKLREISRVRKVHTTLQPFLERCESITFDLVYQSSLPSPVGLLSTSLPLLRKLSLTCSIHDLDDNENTIATPRRVSDILQEQKRVPQLRELTVTGIGYIELSQSFMWKYYTCINLEKLSITHFTFVEGSASDNKRSFETFRLSTKFCRNLTSLSLAQLASDPPISSTPPPKIVLKMRLLNYLALDEVSDDLITAFFGEINDPLTWLECVKFTRCALVNLDLKRRPLIKHLILERISEFPPLVLPCDTLGDTPFFSRSGIQHAMESFYTINVTFLSCSGVTDDLLAWLASIYTPPAPLEEMVRADKYTNQGIFRFEDCIHFTSGALVALLSVFSACNFSKKKVAMRIQVVGSGPMILRSEAELIVTQKLRVGIKWDVRGGAQGTGDGFLSEFSYEYPR